jgi:hypothetical protein
VAFPTNNGDGRPGVAESAARDGGWVRLWRRSLDSEQFADPLLWHLFSWCLLSANHSTQHVRVKIGRGETVVRVEPGQFLYGRKSAAKKFSLPESTVSDRMKRLAAMGAISIQADTHFSIVNIVNWGIYQSNGGKARHPTDTQPTGNRQATDRQPTPNRHPTDTYKNEETEETEENEENVSNNNKGQAVVADNLSFSSPPTSTPWEHARGLARELEKAGTFRLRGGLKPKATESQRRDVLRACMLVIDGTIQAEWVQEVATSTRDSKPAQNAYGYFLKLVRETCGNHGVDYNAAAAGVEVPPNLLRRADGDAQPASVQAPSDAQAVPSDVAAVPSGNGDGKCEPMARLRVPPEALSPAEIETRKQEQLDAMEKLAGRAAQ